MIANVQAKKISPNFSRLFSGTHRYKTAGNFQGLRALQYR